VSTSIGLSTLIGDQAHSLVLNSGQALVAGCALDEAHQSIADGSEKLTHRVE
jgi:hypothetical protein